MIIVSKRRREAEQVDTTMGFILSQMAHALSPSLVSKDVERSGRGDYVNVGGPRPREELAVYNDVCDGSGIGTALQAVCRRVKVEVGGV